MELTSLSLSGWYHVLLGLSIELGLAAGGLYFIAFMVHRRWSERSLVAVLAAAFVWMIHVTRSVQLQSAYWTHYLAFLALNYPTGLYPLVAQQTQQDYQVVQQSTNQLGWTAVLVTEVTIAFGGCPAVPLVRPAHPRSQDFGGERGTSGRERAGVCY